MATNYRAVFEEKITAQEKFIKCLDPSFFLYRSYDGGQAVFPIYGASGGIQTSILAVLVLPGPGKSVRMDGGELPRHGRLIIDKDGWAFFGFEVSVFIVETHPEAIEVFLMAQAEAMLAAKKAADPYLNEFMVRTTAKLCWFAHRAKAKWAALKAA